MYVCLYISHLSLSEMNYISLCMLCITMYITPLVSNSLSEDNACICCMKVLGNGLLNLVSIFLESTTTFNVYHF